MSRIYNDHELYLAAKNGHLDDFKRILDRVSEAANSSVDDVLHRFRLAGNTLLHVAAKHGNRDIVAFIATEKPSLLLANNFSGETALHVAAREGDEAMATVLVRIQQALLMAENERGNTALHEALLSGEKSKSIAEYLIQQDPRLSYSENNKGQSALYLAAKAGFVSCVSLILQQCSDERRLDGIFREKSPIKAAIKRKDRAVLDAIFDAKPRLIEMRDRWERNPLHFAASFGLEKEANYLLQKCALNATRGDEDGALPIHWAASKGHVDIIILLLEAFPYAGELLDTKGCNILHFAAHNGKHNVFKYALKDPRFDCLVNTKDRSGNTPLHRASSRFHPRIVSALTWDERVDVKAVNDRGMTALDFAEECMRWSPRFRQRLTWVALKSASIPRRFAKVPSSSAAMKAPPPYGPYYYSNDDSNKRKIFDIDHYKERMNTLLVVAILVATVTFAAGFTLPGGYISSDAGVSTDTTGLGMATMLRDKGFHVFVFCDTIAMYSSIFAATALFWTQLGDIDLAIAALSVAMPLLGIALGMMSMAFTAGMIIAFARLKWLSTTILAMGVALIAILFVILLPLCTLLDSRSPMLRYLSYYPFLVLVLVTGNG